MDTCINLTEKISAAIIKGINKALNEDVNNDEPKQIGKWFDKYFKLKTESSKYGKHQYYVSMNGTYKIAFDGNYNNDMRFFFKHGINKFSSVNGITVGFSEKEQKWYGWSHRAIFGFGIGDKSVECYPGETKKGKKCETLDDCKQAAIKFAESVS